MTDLDTFISILNDAGYSEGSFPHGPPHGKQYELTTEANVGIFLLLGQGTGYSGFYCVFNFNTAGKLIEHGVWE